MPITKLLGADTPKPAAKSDKRKSFTDRTKIDTDSLKKLFTAAEPSEPVKKLKLLLSSRVVQGRRRNLDGYQTFAAIDAAYNIAYKQTKTTLVQKLLAGGFTDDQLKDELTPWGLEESDVFDCVTCNNVKTRTRKHESLHRVEVPLVKAMTTIRSAKIFNERNGYPLLPYDPSLNSSVEQAKCEILTQLGERMVHQLGYRSYLKQVILQMTVYGVVLMLPREAWHVDWAVDENGDPYARKEGLRYHIPHPSRMSYDLNYMPSLFNSDSGGEWAQHWRLLRVADIKHSPLYYNTKNIPLGTNWFDAGISGRYFTEVYPCVGKSAFQPGVSPEDRDQAAKFYADDALDESLFLTDQFAKLVPSQWGLGDWAYPVWFRFVMANDEQIVWAEPLPYNPILYCGYDANENSEKNPSMALEVLPSQVALSNLQSQIIAASRQNLKKLVLFDQASGLTRESLEMQNKVDLGDLTFLGFSSKQWQNIGQIDPSRVMIPVGWPLQNIVELITATNSIITTLERQLGMSSNESGAAGVHVQTAMEVRVIDNNMSNRVEYTGFAVDAMIEAWKVQIYDAMREFGSEEFVSQVTNSPEFVEPLKKLGFEMGETFENKTAVTGTRGKLVIAGLVAGRSNKNRLQQPEVAQVMMQTVLGIASNPVMMQSAGAKQLIDLLVKAAILGGAQTDFKVRVDEEKEQAALKQQSNPAPEQVSAPAGEARPDAGGQLQQVAQQIQQGAVEEALKQVSEGVAPVVQQVKQNGEQIQQMAEVVGHLKQALEQMMQQHEMIMQTAQAAPPMPPPPMPPGDPMMVPAGPPMMPPGAMPPGAPMPPPY